jgi:hypothetical protein
MSEKEVIKFREAIPYNITIKPAANGGYIVRAGCVTLCFNNIQMLIEALDEYLKNPEGVEKRYNDSRKNSSLAPTNDSCEPRGPMATLSPDDQDQCESPG